MSDIQKVRFDLLCEIHEICEQNDIYYYIDYKQGKINSSTGKKGVPYSTVKMTAKGLLKFIDVFNENPKANRSIEYMGNSEFFPGYFLSYVNENTTFYTQKRASCQKRLGIYVNISVLEPHGYSDLFLRATKQAWEDISYDTVTIGKKIEPYIRLRIEKQIKKTNRADVAKNMFNYFTKLYSKNINKTEKALIESRRHVVINGYPFWVNKESFIFWNNNNVEPDKGNIYSVVENNQNTAYMFFDTEVPYNKLHMEDFFEDNREIFSRKRNQRIKERKVRKNRNDNINKMRRSYYRYLYGLQFEGRMEELNTLLDSEQYMEFDLIVNDYFEKLNEIGDIYVSEKINKILTRRYGNDFLKLFNKTPDIYKDGIKLYDFEGNYIRKVNV